MKLLPQLLWIQSIKFSKTFFFSIQFNSFTTIVLGNIIYIPGKMARKLPAYITEITVEKGVK